MVAGVFEFVGAVDVESCFESEVGLQGFGGLAFPFGVAAGEDGDFSFDGYGDVEGEVGKNAAGVGADNGHAFFQPFGFRRDFVFDINDLVFYPGGDFFAGFN